ncbi:MAG: hypothetical protein LBJ12_08680 [Oscillospiraceae bacterium]|jgi:hypothetical protein|nr:hypothetical protein [Oscillospiraceae bacterium]
MKYFKKSLAAFLAVLFALSTFAAAAFGVAAASSRVSKNTDFIALNDPLEAFERLSSFGVELAAPDSRGFPEDIIVVNSNHIQGLARYGDYTVISVSGDHSVSDTGYFFFYNGQKLLGGFSSPEGLGSHVGAISIAGDYMACSVGTTIVYDLSPLKNGQIPNETPLIASGSLGSTIAIANYQGQESVFFLGGNSLKILPLPLTAESAAITLPLETQAVMSSEYDGTGEWGKLNAWTNDNEALVTDTANNLWLFRLNSRLTLPGKVADLIGEEGMDYEDVALLYKIELTDSGAIMTGPLASKKTEPYDSYLFALGSHFRFGASVQVLDADNFAIISTPSLPGNLFLKEISGTAKGLLDLVKPNVLSINANITRPLGARPPASIANIEQRGLLNWLYQALSWFLKIVNLDYFLGKLGIHI